MKQYNPNSFYDSIIRTFGHIMNDTAKMFYLEKMQ